MKTVLMLVAIATIFTFTRCAPEAITEEQLLIIYPDSGNYGVNLLDTGNSIISGNDFSFSAEIPEKGSLVVRITKTSSGNWFLDQSSVSYWAISNYDPITNSQTFTSTSASKICDLHLEIQSGTYQLEFFENEDSNPTFTYMLKV